MPVHRWTDRPGARVLMSLAAGLLVASPRRAPGTTTAPTRPRPPLPSRPPRPPPRPSHRRRRTPPATTSEAPTTDRRRPRRPRRPTTTALDEEALKAQIAEDYNAAYALREEMYSAPDSRRPRGATGSRGRAGLAELHGLRGVHSRPGRRRASGWPPTTRTTPTVTAQKVELSGTAPYTEALVTGCLVTNQRPSRRGRQHGWRRRLWALSQQVEIARADTERVGCRAKPVTEEIDHPWSDGMPSRSERCAVGLPQSGVLVASRRRWQCCAARRSDVLILRRSRSGRSDRGSASQRGVRARRYGAGVCSCGGWG